MHFGLFLQLVGDAYVHYLLAANVPRGHDWRLPVMAFSYLRVDYFAIFFLWKFLERFPRSRISFAATRAHRFFELTSLTLGIGFASLTLLWEWWAFFGVSDFWREVALVQNKAWSFMVPLALIAIFFLVHRYRFAIAAERRRARLFSIGLVVGGGFPIALAFLSELVPSISQALAIDPESPGALRLVSNLFILSIPFTTGYAVLKQKVLDVKLIARSAVQHLLARYSATALGLAPFLFLIAFLFDNRQLTLVQLFSGSQALILLGTATVGLVFLRYRSPILDAIDRRFFRDRYNARRVLTQLAEQVRGTRNLVELSRMVGSGVDLALHLEGVTLLAHDPRLGRFVDPLEGLRPLDPGSRLATLVAGNHDPLTVDFNAPSSPLQSLDEQEKHWLIDGKVELLAPAYSLDGSMIGMLVLSSKKSELPFLREDRELLKGVCSAAGLVIELLFLKDKTPQIEVATIPASPSGRFPALPAVDPAQQAMECPNCTRVFPPTDAVCPTCKIDLDPTLAPYVLRGQYRFESRLGSGGMAVVYAATDLRLGRTVAIKTLPRVSPEAAMRLHREARTAATVTHPGLAAIYGIETWEGVPLLILELLPGGTLADHLIHGEPLDALLAIDMGKTVALALQKIHNAGILHRDIKPSNIGYTEDGHAKLLDFGVARIHHDLRLDSSDEDTTQSGESRVLNTASWVIGRTATGQLVGTLGYLSPEAVRGQRPEPSFDLWSLSVVLWESLTGENLFRSRNYQHLLDEIMAVRVRDIRDSLPECPSPVVKHFRRELSPDPAERASSGRELYDRLETLRLELLGSSVGR